MSGTLRRWRWLVLCMVLAACAATQSAVQEEAGEQEAIASLGEWCAQEGSLVALCDAGLCGMYRCREVMEAQNPGRVRLAQMIQAPPLLGPGSSVAEQEAERRKPHEKHHIFPQEPRLKAWFDSKEINVHDYTMPLPIEVHRRIHHPPPAGGDWNEAWRTYQREHRDAPKEDIMRYAGQLIYEFGLTGPVVPYYRRWTQPPPMRSY